MDNKKVFEFWLVKPNGEKLNKFITTNTTDEEIVKERIEVKFDLKIKECTEFKLKAF